MKRLFELREFTQAQFEPIKSFYLQNDLYPSVWNNFKLNKEIKQTLIQIAYDYFDYLELEDVELNDIIFTGSLANYNWSQYSDFDIHLVFDFSDVNKDVNLVEKYLDAKEKVWKLQHDIKIKGFPVELFCENIDAERISTGVYSLLDDDWLVRPTKVNFKPDEFQIRKKAEKFMSEIKDIEEEMNSQGTDLEELSERLEKVWKRIKDSRKAGLSEKGEFSLENLVFKLLRRNGYIERVVKMRRLSYDKRYK